MKIAHTASVRPIDCLALERFLRRRRCRLLTFVQILGKERYSLFRAIIDDISVTGLGLITHNPLPLGPAIVELPTEVNCNLRLVTVRIRTVTAAAPSLWRIEAEFTRPLHLTMATELMD
jgi:hypothetical protein